MEIAKVGVVGCGLMGSGIAQVAAQAGCDVLVREPTDDLLQKGRQRIEGALGKAVEKGKLDAKQRAEIAGRIRYTTRLEDLGDRDLVVEAIVENLDEKRALFRILDGVCPPAAIFASNTSSLPIGDLAVATDRPQRFVGLHFFNPVPVMKLVEVVRTLDTSEEAFEAACAFARKIGKTVVRAQDTPGFVVNVLLVPYLLDAIRQLERGLASKEDIDAAMKLGCGYPMGPFELLDFVGLDTTLSIADIMFAEFKDAHYAAPPMLRRLVAAGRHGKKSGRGFYDHRGEAKAAKGAPR